MGLQVKSKLRAARACLEQLTTSKDAVLCKVHPEHGPANARLDLLQSEAPNQSMPSMQVRLSQPPDQRPSQHQPQEQGQPRADADSKPTLLNRDNVVHPAVVRDDDIEEDFNLCVICIEIPPQVNFQTCGHAVACKTCASKILIQTGECPMCRCQLSALELLPACLNTLGPLGSSEV